ncbi:MAG: response regulator transcription factor [Pyrinomonadaceae bacterium]
MFAPESQIAAPVDSETYPLGEKSEHAGNGSIMALLALSHTTIEHRLYIAMLASLNSNGKEAEPFTGRRLMGLTDIRSLSTIRRGLDGLVAKLSIEREAKGAGRRNGRGNGNGGREIGTLYRVFAPEQVLARRQELGWSSAITGIETREHNHSFERAIKRVVENQKLSRREAQVALCCVEGLTNAEIGQRLQVTEQTVKFHLRHVFIKFGVKRRAGLISRLLM